MTQTNIEEEHERTILRCLYEHYGIEGSLSRLPGENLNYRVLTGGGERFIFKIVDDDMPPEIVEMEYAVIEYAISHRFPIKLPKILKNKQGKIETGIILRKYPYDRARLLEFIDGTQLDSMSDISIKMCKNIGKTLADFDVVMKNFEHPAARRNHRWNLAEADQHRPKLVLFEDREQRELLTWAFDFWEFSAKPKFSTLPHQFIHGDAHGENILMAGESVAGLLDFGDCCFNPTICELGVCLPYLMMEQADPLGIASRVVSAYHETRPLTDQELSVLLPLICGRLAVTISVAEERRQIDSSRPNWFSSDEEAWALLRFLYESESERGQISFL